MRIKIIPLLTKSLYNRIAAGIHSFAHPYQSEQQEGIFADALAEARQSEAYVVDCINKFRDTAHKAEQQAKFYQELARHEHRMRAEEQRKRAEVVCTSEHCGFKNWYEPGYVDSAYFQDQPTYNEGHADGYAARVHDELRLHENGYGRHSGEYSHGETRYDKTPNAVTLDEETQHRGYSEKDDTDGEDLQDLHLYGPMELDLPSPPPTPPRHRWRTGKRPESHSPRKPYFPWHGDVRP